MSGAQAVLTVVVVLLVAVRLGWAIREVQAWRRRAASRRAESQQREAHQRVMEERQREEQRRARLAANPWGVPEIILPESYVCTGCSRKATGPEANLTWSLRSAFKIRGQYYAQCGSCATGVVPAEEEDSHCGGKCDGKYQSSGTYYRAVVGGFMHEVSWSCWDEDCAAGWLEEQDDTCFECGSHIDGYLVTMQGDREVERTRV